MGSPTWRRRSSDCPSGCLAAMSRGFGKVLLRRVGRFETTLEVRQDTTSKLRCGALGAASFFVAVVGVAVQERAVLRRGCHQ
jgi:hypothetical protein